MKKEEITRITDFNVNWLKIKNACRTTVGMKDSSVEPTDEWKRKLLICRHSPLRLGTVTFMWDEIPYCTSVHFCRHHEGVEKFCKSSRPDRSDIKDRGERKQTDFITMEMIANIEAIMNISERRLCTCADSVTRKYWQSFLEELKKCDENIYWACVPQCIRHGACVEPFSDCKYFDKFAETLTKDELTDMQKRLTKYNEYRRKL